MYNKLTSQQKDSLYTKLILTIAELEEEVERRRQTIHIDTIQIKEANKFFEVQEEDIEIGKKLANGPGYTAPRITMSNDNIRTSMGIMHNSTVRAKFTSEPFVDLIHVLVIVLSDLSAGTMHLSDVLGLGRKPDFNDFKLFLQTFEVYGSGYQDDVDVNNYKRRDVECHTEVSISQLERILKLYEITMSSFQLQKNDSIIGGLPVVNK